MEITFSYCALFHVSQIILCVVISCIIASIVSSNKDIHRMKRDYIQKDDWEYKQLHKDVDKLKEERWSLLKKEDLRASLHEIMIRLAVLEAKEEKDRK